MMQKVQKHVINIFLVLLIFNCKAKSIKDDDYVLINKVIEQTKDNDTDLYKLNKNVNTEPLKKYYGYRYLNKPLFDFIKGYDEKKDSIIYDNNLSKKSRKTWDLKYSVLDETFSKEDIESILENFQISKWDTTKLDNNIEVLKKVERNDKNRKTTFYGGNSISEPLYSIDKKHAIIQHYYVKTFTTLFVFRKEGEDWVQIGAIKNIW